MPWMPAKKISMFMPMPPQIATTMIAGSTVARSASQMCCSPSRPSDPSIRFSVPTFGS